MSGPVRVSGTGAHPRPPRGCRARIALSTASVYPETCADTFAMASRLGYDGVEVMVWTDAISQDAEALARLSLHYDVPVLSVHAPTLLVTQRVWGREPWAKLDRSCRMAVALGAGTVVVHPPFRWQREYAAGFVPGIADLEHRHQVRLAVENMYPWRAGNRSVLAYLPGWDPVPQPYSFVTLDVSHAATAGTDALAVAEELGSRLAHVHLSDSLGSARDEHLVPGRGNAPCAELLAMLADTGFDGTVVIEINTRRSRSREERERDLAEALAFTRRHLSADRPDVDPLTAPVTLLPGPARHRAPEPVEDPRHPGRPETPAEGGPAATRRPGALVSLDVGTAPLRLPDEVDVRTGRRRSGRR